MTKVKENSINRKYMLWMDLEMSGLDPEKDRIIEVASVITDGELNIIEEGPHMVIYQSDAILDGMDAWNKKQHKKSGLIELVKASRITTEEAEEELLGFVKKHCPPNVTPLCGNSIHHDRRFLIKYMPQLHAYLHYRMVDVTTIKALVQRWYPKPKLFSKKKDIHRATDDMHNSINELKFLREHYFVREHKDA